MRKYVLAMAAVFAALIALVAPATAAPAQQDLKIMHSFGYKNLLLGMSAKQAEATGLVELSFSGTDYDFYSLVPSEGERNANVLVYVHKTCGVQWIDATNPTKTLRGIGIGSTREELMAAYPDAHVDPARPHELVAKAPLNPGTEFRFVVGFDGKVGWMLVRKSVFC